MPFLFDPKVKLIAILSMFLLLTACGNRHVSVDTDQCISRDDLKVICGLQSPEDLVQLPDGSGVIVSEMLGLQGRISLLDVETGGTITLYDAVSSNDLSANWSLWGDSDCQEPEIFSPHGVDLSRKSNGKWQLLVVNHRQGLHGELSVEKQIGDSVEFFELLDRDGEWFLQWRGCTHAETGVQLNDIAATPRGFYVTQLQDSKLFLRGIWAALIGKKPAQVWQWDLAGGFQKSWLPSGAGYNGIFYDKDAKRLLVNDYIGGETVLFDAVSKKKLHYWSLGAADNLSVSPNGELLTTVHDSGLFSLLTLASCSWNLTKNCEMNFSVHSLNIDSHASELLYQGDAHFFGAASVALKHKKELLLGSFAGDRVLRVPSDLSRK